jgi:Na+-transporting NADH:ubiquinone oxidoreductase subunit C
MQQKAYLQVFGLGDPLSLAPAEVAEIVEKQVVTGTTLTDPETGAEYELIMAYADPEKSVIQAYGVRFRGFGFWAPIEGILALGPDLSETVGLAILDQKETPGLGGRIEEPVFTSQFREGIRVSPPSEGGAEYIKISATPPQAGSEAAERHVDAISGATQTCLAMDRILNETLQGFHRAAQTAGLTADGPGRSSPEAGR